MKTLAIFAAAAAFALGACSSEPDQAELAELDNRLVGNDADPALTSALEDQITVDPNLAQQSNELAVRRAPAPGRQTYPPRSEAEQRAAVESLRNGGSACGAQFDYDAAWARRLPAAFGVYPGGRITEAAGNNSGDCRMRVVTFASNSGWEPILDWYRVRADRAGYASEHELREGDHVLAGVNGDAAYYLIVTPKGRGSDVAFIANNGR